MSSIQFSVPQGLTCAAWTAWTTMVVVPAAAMASILTSASNRAVMLAISSESRIQSDIEMKKVILAVSGQATVQSSLVSLQLDCTCAMHPPPLDACLAHTS